jgi:hypothetical protein
MLAWFLTAWANTNAIQIATKSFPVVSRAGGKLLKVPFLFSIRSSEFSREASFSHENCSAPTAYVEIDRKRMGDRLRQLRLWSDGEGA